MAALSVTAQALDYLLSTINHFSWASKVDLRVVISEEDHLKEMRTTCYIVIGLYGADFWSAISLNTLMDWAEDNQDYLLHLTLTTIFIPPSDPPVCPSRLRPTRSHIAPQFLVLQFPLHQTLTSSSVCNNLLQSPYPLMPLAKRPHPLSTRYPLRDPSQLSEILGFCIPSRRKSSNDCMSLQRLCMILPSDGRSW